MASRHAQDEVLYIFVFLLRFLSPESAQKLLPEIHWISVDEV